MLAHLCNPRRHPLDLGTVAEQLNRADIGQPFKLTGFLGMSRNGRGVLLHITHIEPA